MDKPCLQNHLYFKTTKLWPFLKVNGLPVCYDNYGLMNKQKRRTRRSKDYLQGLENYQYNTTYTYFLEQVSLKTVP